ncbi:MAG TPA: zf-HC2 domain-containing protein [Candidatus Cybelea sp.]|jgi:anti-sigma factor RsiW|nr:zf-HC2 domain-containing protein [Candidatus Cybelea sp.]
MNDAHAGERAALYALGALDDAESAAMEGHLRVCAECAKLVGEAERDVDTIASLETRRRAPDELTKRVERLLAPASRQRASWPRFAAIAAAFVIGVLPSVYLWERNAAMRDAMLSQSAAMDRLATSEHRTASFRPTSEALAANVMYAPDGSWYVIVVRGASHALQVAWMHDGAQTMLGVAVPHGRVAMLYLPKSHRMEQLALMDGPRVVAEAQLP